MAPVDRDAADATDGPSPIEFAIEPYRYRHWKLEFAAPIARLSMDVDEDGGIDAGYKLKLNSYDLGVDIELHDALQRIRFEHPEVKTVVITSSKPRMFCSGANIYMLGLASHAQKVNFCKFTNETRNSMEHSSRHSGLRFLAAVNGACAGGGYELALACDRILFVDDRSSAVSLPEVALLGVLPGTGGLTRLTDKRGVRRDLADVFCTTQEGQRAERAKAWRLIDESATPGEFAAAVERAALDLAAHSDRPANTPGVVLGRLARRADAKGYHYRYLDVAIEPSQRVAVLTFLAPEDRVAQNLDEILRSGASWYPLQLARELDDAILNLRFNHLEIGTWIFKSHGPKAEILAADRALMLHLDHWFVREVKNFYERTLARLEVSARSMIALIERHSCFAGSLMELVLAADRSYMLDVEQGPEITLSAVNFGALPQVNGRSRLATRFGDSATLDNLRALEGVDLAASAAASAGLVTFTPDDIDWDDEIRLAIEERTSLSPDALTALEASLRFAGNENLATRIFGRLTAWQNWVFVRPNASGEYGALKVFGSGRRARFDWKRV